jgi:hypothetical protein
MFFAVAIGLLTVLGAGLAGHLTPKAWWHKWFFWVSGLVIVVLIYFQAQSYKEPPTASQIATAVVKQIHDTTQAAFFFWAGLAWYFKPFAGILTDRCLPALWQPSEELHTDQHDSGGPIMGGALFHPG